MEPLHVGLDLVYLQPDSGGSGTYARELIAAIKRVEPATRITAWVGTGAPDVDWPVEWVRLPVKSTGSPVHVPVELLWLGLDARRRGVDVVHGLAYATPIVAPGVATLVTLLDLTWHHHPEAATWLARRMFGLLSPLCGRASDRVIAISETVKADLIATLGLPAHKIDVTPLGVSDGELAPPVAPDIQAPILLCVAQMSRHKNLLALVEALARMRDTEAVLVIPGRRTDHSDELLARAAQLGVADRLKLPGYVSDGELEGLYAAARGFVLPSLLEGFGLPVLEAMRRGVPVACSDASALPEVAGGAALLFDPHDPAAIAAACDRLLAEPGDLADRGRARAAACRWETTAETTLAAYRRALRR